MSRIDELVSALCPAGVESKPLGDIGSITRGRRFVKADMVKSGTPCIHYGELYTKYGTWATEAHSYLDPAMASRLRVAEPRDVIFVSTGETVEDIGKAVAWLGTTDVVIHDALYSFRSPLDPKFVAYFSQTREFHTQIRHNISSSKVSAISPDNLRKVRIPAPPPEIQREVVQVLDRFAELEAELEAELKAELNARRRQYVHYRDTLLTFPESGAIRWVPLRELGRFYGGLTGKSKTDFAGGNAPYVTYMNIFENLATQVAPGTMVRVAGNERQHRIRRGDLLFTGSSETPEEVGMSSVVTTEPPTALYLNSFCIGFRPHDSTLLQPDFAKHLLRAAPMRRQIMRTASGVTRFNVSKARLGRVVVPIPPPDEQLRVTSVLDKLDALVNDLSTGLPAELAARRKQYEHYRDRLLTFKEAA